MFHIAAFYHFAPLPGFEAHRRPLLDLAASEGVKGTILLASEGVNGTIAGPLEGVDSVIAALRGLPGMEGLEPKWSTAEIDPFLRLKVRLKREIVSLGVGEVDSVGNTGTKVPATEWNELISDPNVLLIDTRNSYEYAIGSFEGAVDPGTRSFRQFPEWIANDSRCSKDRPIAMFCTGGIRCEKATAYLKEQGFENVYQLEGGVLKYLEMVNVEDSMWDGQCYVFDRRVSVGHGLEPGDLQVCPNCNSVIDDIDREAEEYVEGVMCGHCHDTITPERIARFAERQRQIDLAAERGDTHLGRSA